MTDIKLEILFDEVLRYIGYKEDIHVISDDMKQSIKKNIDIVKNNISLRSLASNVINIEEIDNCIVAGDVLKLPGKDIKAHLKNCYGIIVMGVTLGNEVDTLIRRTEIINMSDAVILDAACNVAIEEYSKICEEDIRNNIMKDNKYLTMRYSPGYGDLPIDIQDELVKIIDGGRKIGLYVTPSHIMIPRKSITSIMGVANIEVKGKMAGCSNCVMNKKCIYKKRGTTCV